MFLLCSVPIVCIQRPQRRRLDCKPTLGFKFPAPPKHRAPTCAFQLLLFLGFLPLRIPLMPAVTNMPFCSFLDPQEVITLVSIHPIKSQPLPTPHTYLILPPPLSKERRSDPKGCLLLCMGYFYTRVSKRYVCGWPFAGRAVCHPALSRVERVRDRGGDEGQKKEDGGESGSAAKRPGEPGRARAGKGAQAQAQPSPAHLRYLWEVRSQSVTGQGVAPSESPSEQKQPRSPAAPPLQYHPPKNNKHPLPLRRISGDIKWYFT